jgi:hypothetical protein
MYGEPRVTSDPEMSEMYDSMQKVAEALVVLRRDVFPDDSKLAKDLRALKRFLKPEPVRYRTFFWMPDFCISLSTPFRWLPRRSRYYRKKTAKWGIFFIEFGWFTFSVRW